LAKAEEVAEVVGSLAMGGVWGIIKSGLHHDTLDVMARDPRIVNAFDDNAAAKARL